MSDEEERPVRATRVDQHFLIRLVDIVALLFAPTAFLRWRFGGVCPVFVCARAFVVGLIWSLLP